jgi:hypothetical protein
MKESSQREAARRRGVETFRERFPEARAMWRVTVPHVGTIEAFYLGRSVVLIEDYQASDGWQAFTPTTDDGRIDATLDAIAARCYPVSAPIDVLAPPANDTGE